jgi:hypothetical protein
MSDTILAYLVSVDMIGAGVVWIVVGTVWTASDLCIAIGMVTIVVGWTSFMVEIRSWGALLTKQKRRRCQRRSWCTT